MNRKTRLFAILGIIALLVLGLACTNDGAAGNLESGAPEVMEIAASGTEMAAVATRESVAGSGIWVNGQATVTVEPDLVLLNIGVEAIAETVAEARAEASSAMDAIVEAVKVHGLEDQDVQTKSFNIWPQYEYPEVTSGGTRTRKQVLVGYTVNNSARIKIRDVDAVGTIIDAVAEAGGDATRIDGINFSIEDPKPFMTQLREEAVQDASSQGRASGKPHGCRGRQSAVHRRSGRRHTEKPGLYGGVYGIVKGSGRLADVYQRRRTTIEPERAGGLLDPVAAFR